MLQGEALAALLDDVTKFAYDPEEFTDYAYPWGEKELSGAQGQRVWQRKINRAIASELKRLKGRKNRVIKIAVASGHDIGKTAETAFIQNWGMSTRPNTKIRVTANTGNQLKTTTWAELSKWHQMSIAKELFTCTATSFYSNVPKYALTWRSDAAVWRENSIEGFAGLHNSENLLIVILDESSGIPIPIWHVVEGACTDEYTDILVIAFGNPTRNSGQFFDIFNSSKIKRITLDRYLAAKDPDKLEFDWIVAQIDSRDVEGTNKEEIEKMRLRHGDDSDFFRTRVRGMFPRASSMQFLPTDLVGEAMRRKGVSIIGDPLIMGIDFAWGGDDNVVLYFRRGMDAQGIPPIIVPGELMHDPQRLIPLITEACRRWQPNMIFGDRAGVGAAIMSQLNHLGYRCTQVNFGGKAPDDHFYDMTAYMGARAKEWLLNGGALWENPEFEAQLTQREYDQTTTKNQLFLETKKDLKKRGLMSPDIADAFFLTFAQEVAPLQGNRAVGRPARPRSTWDPLDVSRWSPPSGKPRPRS